MNPHISLPLILVACFGANVVFTSMRRQDQKKGVSRRWLRVLISVLYALGAICGLVNMLLYFAELYT